MHALYAGWSSGDQVTVAIAINGRKAAADLNAGLASEVSLQGTVNGSQVTMKAQNGIGLDGSLSGRTCSGPSRGSSGRLPVLRRAGRRGSRYSGWSSDNQVTLAVVTDGDKAAAYVCNGKTVEAWLQGSVHGNQVSLTGLHGAGLTGSLSGWRCSARSRRAPG